ncbi:TIGR03826 family flagellar region protein [Tepidimicrobium xylanilyticum]|uniref:Flagellar operon protein TIGR03826 n=1 Tax=Tepidimicrobium xylanilyticum TaxID=1123352 RepID=A0A1H2QWC6_9FIRM|nr:TIGR03826 family flagellar region protein [Tepidimicrobium xylanilyticum]GMG95575.1 hypothetical protein EN5CB1_04010 [Tepidimicrobium xylanilyticum]SDW10944.1 flagellar operon protein TIGR03826 [Tepidimicrobium xylanilyticum]
MDVRNCSRCGMVYVYDGFKICLRCRKSDEEDFKKVKGYLDENPGANISEVSEETGVSTKKIIEFLRQGRLEVADEHNIILTCERCGTSIKTGRFCDKCTLEMQREFKKSIGGGKEPDSIRSGKIKERIRITERRKEK